ncbi:MAG: hypothetical protein KDJ97_02200 [Anaerolineae bacterium]|nr:hypothetical protein [Anaerolineae bacterium]
MSKQQLKKTNKKTIAHVSPDMVEIKPRRIMTLEEIKGSVPPLDLPKSWRQIREEKQDEYAERYSQTFNS